MCRKQRAASASGVPETAELGPAQLVLSTQLEGIVRDTPLRGHGRLDRRAVAERCPNAVPCIDAFHVVQGATDALDEVRRDVWNQARRSGQDQLAHRPKGARYALWKDPENLTGRQQAKLAEIQQINRRLYRAYLLKERLRQIYRLPAEAAIALLDRWIAWARRCRLPSFVKLAKTITAQRPGITAAIENGLSNARVEAANTTIRLIARRAFGFHTADALIALCAK
jgi:transposase